MRDVVVTVAALEHQHLVCVVCFGSLDQGDEIANQLRAEEIHGWSEDLGKEKRPVDVHGDRLECPGMRGNRGGHERTLLWSLARNSLMSAATSARAGLALSS
jgi:hypothetical protein